MPNFSPVRPVIRLGDNKSVSQSVRTLFYTNIDNILLYLHNIHTINGDGHVRIPMLARNRDRPV